MRKLIFGIIVWLIPGVAVAANFGMSKAGESATLTFQHTVACDSGRVWFGYQDSTNWYASYKLMPAGWDNTTLLSSELALDSIGTHVARVSYWETGAGSVSGYVAGIWLHDDDITTTVGAGTGPNSVIVRCKSATDSAAIPGATIAVWNSDETALMRLRSTDTDSGKAEFNLDNGTYKLRIVKYKFQWATPIALGVAANKDTTIYATEFTPSPPPYDSMCTVYGYVDSVGLTGSPAFVHITIHAQNLRVGTLVLAHSSYTKKIRINSSGYWETHLWPNALITPAATTYHVRIETPYMVVDKYVTVPQATSWEFTW